MVRNCLRPAGASLPALCAVAFLVGAIPARAADRGTPPEARAVYERDRAQCMYRKEGDERKTCLREAGAALQESRRGGLTDEAAQFDKNRLARCGYQPAADRAECIRRMNEGTTSGSVESGAILRELRTFFVPAK